MTEQFKKFDDGKPMVSLVEPEFVVGIAKVLTAGAEKYGKNNWKLNTDKSRYIDALLRHTMAYLSGEMNDPETGYPHLHHAGCNLMFLHYLEGEGK